MSIDAVQYQKQYHSSPLEEPTFESVEALEADGITVNADNTFVPGDPRIQNVWIEPFAGAKMMYEPVTIDGQITGYMVRYAKLTEATAPESKAPLGERMTRIPIRMRSVAQEQLTEHLTRSELELESVHLYYKLTNVGEDRIKTNSYGGILLLTHGESIIMPKNLEYYRSQLLKEGHSRPPLRK